MRILLSVLVSLALNTSALAQDASPIEPVQSPAAHFDFHIDPWVSLHYFAFHLAKAADRERRLRGRVPIRMIDRQLMTSEFRRALEPAIEAYTPYIDQNLLFDDELRELGVSVRGGPQAISDPAVRDALIGLMPHYMETHWPSHQAQGFTVLRQLMTLLARHEQSVASEIVRQNGGQWPAEAVRVDLTPYANWAGAFTSNAPDLITMATSDPNIAGAHGLEILFHEAMHTYDLAGGLREAMMAAANAAGIDDSRLWHDVQFYIAGAIVSEVLNISDHRMYVDALGLSENSAAEYRIIAEVWAMDGLTRNERLEIIAQRLAVDTDGPEAPE